MRLHTPTLPRALLAAVLACGLTLAPATAAVAHTGAASSYYRVQIMGWVGDHRGAELRIVELGNRVELRRTTAATVMVLGYEGEPYVRLDASGVAENTASPAHVLNRDRYASTELPVAATAGPAPTWMHVGAGAVVRWHDHRAHWMSSTPRADVQAEPDVERVVIDAGRVDLVIDGRPASALVRVTGLPRPDRWLWWIVACGLGLAVAAGFVFVPRAGALLAPAAGGAVLAATRLDVFDHELIAGWLAGGGQRAAIAVGAGACVGVLASPLVGALEPTEPAA